MNAMLPTTWLSGRAKGSKPNYTSFGAHRPPWGASWGMVHQTSAKHPISVPAMGVAFWIPSVWWGSCCRPGQSPCQCQEGCSCHVALNWLSSSEAPSLDLEWQIHWGNELMWWRVSPKGKGPPPEVWHRKSNVTIELRWFGKLSLLVNARNLHLQLEITLIEILIHI